MDKSSMLPACRWITYGVLLAAPVLAAQTAPSAEPSQKTPATTTTPKAHHKKTHKPPKPLVLPQLPGGPLSQLPMDQIPASPAKVSYQDGLLTISAQNSTMGEILRDVRKLTGAMIEIPPHASAENERVITHLGPGTPRDVLVSLLNGSSFNYVMLGSNTDPAVVSSIILTSKTPAPGDTQTAANVPQSPPSPGIVMPPHPIPPSPGFNPQGQPQIAPGGAEADESANEENTDDNANAEDQAQPGQPGQPDVNGANTEQQQPQDPNAGPKTPEQILEMLRRQQPPGGNNNPNQPPPPPPQE
jgi:hypothetical protein